MLKRRCPRTHYEKIIKEIAKFRVWITHLTRVVLFFASVRLWLWYESTNGHILARDFFPQITQYGVSNPMIFEFEESQSQNARMKVVGVGGGGGNAVNRMIEEHLEGVEFISVNTDAQALLNSKSDVKIQIGKKLTRGLGAGARPEIGRQAIEENRDEVARVLTNADLVFVTCGMGGGTGTGAAPIICEMSRDAGALTVGIVTKPCRFDGRKRMRQAAMGIPAMRKHVDTITTMPNPRLLAVVGKGIPFQDALKKADEVLLHATQGISALITVTGLVNVDFADVRTVMQQGGAALMGTGVGRGDNRAMEAAQQAISSPLLDNVSISGATGVLVNITGGQDLTLGEVHQINEIIHDAVGDDAEIIFGAVHEPAMQGEVRVTVIATGFDRAVQAQQPEPITPKGAPVIPFPALRPVRTPLQTTRTVVNDGGQRRTGLQSGDGCGSLDLSIRAM